VYLFCTAAYQGGAGGRGVKTVLQLAQSLRFPKPDLVLLLDLDPAEAEKRMNRPKDRVEEKGTDYQWKVRSTFLKMARDDKRRFRVVDASRPADEVHRDIVKAVGRAL